MPAKHAKHPLHRGEDDLTRVGQREADDAIVGAAQRARRQLVRAAQLDIGRPDAGLRIGVDGEPAVAHRDQVVVAVEQVVDARRARRPGEPALILIEAFASTSPVS